MANFKDLTNQAFGDWLVLERDFDYKKQHNLKSTGAYWKVKCLNCGITKIVSSSNLLTGDSTNCGCRRKGKNGSNLIGKRFGSLIVIEKTSIRKNRRIVWKCLCDCGNYIMVDTTSLTQGNTTSCGCYRLKQIQKATITNLTNQRFGKLIALYPTNKRVAWHCICDCGNECNVSSNDLSTGKIKSCGCLSSSYGEFVIENLLQENNIKFEREKNI